MNDHRSEDGPLDRAFAILDFVAGQLKAVTSAEISKALDLPLPSAHRLIGNLEVRGLLQRAPGTKRFMVGNSLVNLAGKTIGSAFRTARRHAVLRRVAEQIGEQCEIGIVKNASVSYVDNVRLARSQGLQFDPGSNAPLHCTSTGKIYLSRMPPKARRKLVYSLSLFPYTETTVSDPEALLRMLDETQSAGWARTKEEYVRGVVGCGVPILAPDRKLIACLGVSVPTTRVNFGELERFREPLIEAATLLSETILQIDADDAE